MSTTRIKGTPHSEEVISKILQMNEEGVRSKDIYKQSKELFGYCVKQSTICNILKRYGKDAKINTYRVRKGWKKYKKTQQIGTVPSGVPDQSVII